MGNVSGCMSRNKAPDDDDHTIRKRGKADMGGLVEGDVLVSVNGEKVAGSSQTAATDSIDSANDSLSLTVNRASRGIDIPIVMQQSISMQSDPGDVGHISEQTRSFITPDGTRISVTSTEAGRYAAGPKHIEENKRAMRQRYAISNVFLEKTKPELGQKVKSEENLRRFRTNTNNNNPMFSSMVTAQLRDSYGKENVSPMHSDTEPKLKQIPVFNVTKLTQQTGTSVLDGKAMHRSMDEGLCHAVQTTQGVKRGKNRMPAHVFGPPVQISLKEQSKNGLSISDPTVKKKQFSDSAFYDDDSNSYPTIEEQMKLCQAISRSLTASANQKARGARMFAKRQKRASYWIHEGPSSGPSSDFSSEGDVSSLEDLSSELSVEEGGDKPLFQFRIPKVAQQIAPFDFDSKMSLSRSDFEDLRLNKQRCEHNAVSPVTCFNLAADLQSAKGRGAKIFEKRRQRAEEWVVDEQNVKKASPPENRLQTLIDHPQKQNGLTPWDVVSKNQSLYMNKQMGTRNNVPANNNKPQEMTIVRTADLTTSNKPSLLEGPKFNRTAKGWSSNNRDTRDGISPSRNLIATNTQSSPPVPPKPHPSYRDYNSRPQGWQAADPQLTESYNTFPRSRRHLPPAQTTHVIQTSHTNFHSYPTMMVGASDM